jgi:hypothetical protein
MGRKLTRALPGLAMIRKRALAVLVVTTALAALGSPAVAGAVETPEKDPFYKPPAGYQETAPGTVLKSRNVALGGNGFGVPATQLLFRSNNSHGEAIAAVTTVAIPPTPWTGTGQRPLVSYQMAIDALGSQCNPSYQLQQGNSPEAETAASMYGKGWAVNVPDHEGLDMEYGAGRNAAHITLDSIRAIYNYSALKLTSANPLGLIGYSGGGQATAWTEEAQPSYAPEIHITAATPGGIPVNLEEVAHYNDGGPAFALVLAASLGVDRGYPELELDSILNAAGKTAMTKIAKDCLDEYVYQYPNKKFSEFTKPEYPEPLALPKVENVLGDDSLMKARPDTPTFLWQSAADEVIPVAGVDHLADYYCSEGLSVTYDRGASGEHVSYADNAPAAAAYLEAYFNGESVPSTCGTISSTDTKIDSGPSGEAATNNASFTYSTEPASPGATFECKLDGGAFESCAEGGASYVHLPAGEHTFSVRSVTASGHTDSSPATRKWISPFEPEFGRCVRVPGTGAFTRGNCIELAGSHNGKYEWQSTPGPKPGFTGPIGTVTLQKAGGAVLTCSAGTFSGAFTGAFTQTLSLTLTGCKDGAGKSCSSPLAATGEITSSQLEGETGFIRTGIRAWAGIDYKPVGPATTLLSFECREGAEAPTQVSVEGSVIARVKTINSMKAFAKLVFQSFGVHQSPEKFAGGASDVLSMTTASTSGQTGPEQVGLTMLGIGTTYLLATSEERVEVKAKI